MLLLPTSQFEANSWKIVVVVVAVKDVVLKYAEIGIQCGTYHTEGLPSLGNLEATTFVFLALAVVSCLILASKSFFTFYY